jgi:hypothetical protein
VPNTFLRRRTKKTAMPANTNSWISGEFIITSISAKAWKDQTVYLM